MKLVIPAQVRPHQHIGPRAFVDGSQSGRKHINLFPCRFRPHVTTLCELKFPQPSHAAVLPICSRLPIPCWWTLISFLTIHWKFPLFVWGDFLFVTRFVFCRSFVFFDGLKHRGFGLFWHQLCVCVLHGFRFPDQSWSGIPPATRCHSFCLGINYKEWISRTIFTTATQIFWPLFWPCPLAWVSPKLHFSNPLFSHLEFIFFFEFCSWDAAFVLVCFCWGCNLFRWQLHGADNWLNSYGNSRERKTRKFWANKFNKWFEQTQARDRYIKNI